MTTSASTMTQPVKLNQDWEHLSHLNWAQSDITPFMYQTQITVADKVSLCVEAGGNPNNPPLILIMGLGAQLIFWTDDFIQGLIDKGFFVIRFDNRDIGLSSKMQGELFPRTNLYRAMGRFAVGLSNHHLPVTYKLPDMAEDTVTLIKTLGLTKVSILGASMGGMIAQIVAARYPHLVERLVLLFTTNNKPSLQLLSPTRPTQLKMLFSKPESMDASSVIAHGTNFIKTIGSPGFINDHLTHELSTLRFKRDYSPEGSARQFYAIISTGSIYEYSRAIAAPTLVLHGSEDGLVPTAHGRALAYDIPHAKFVEIQGMGHDLSGYFTPFLVEQLSEFIQPLRLN